MKKVILCIILAIFCFGTQAQESNIDFESDKWELQKGSKVETYMDKKSLVGSAVLKDTEFENGIIEFDINFKGPRCFAGVNFRIMEEGNEESFYLRPHKNKFPDALQYTPVFNGSSAWQLYTNDGFTAYAEIPYDKWFHVKLEIKGQQARVFLHNSETPSLIMNNLIRDAGKGGISLFAPANGLAHFANFSIKEDNTLKFEKQPIENKPTGMFRNWEVTQAFKYSYTDIETHLSGQTFKDIKWQKVEADINGLVNVSRFIPKSPRGAKSIFAKTTIHSKEEKQMKVAFGYSDVVSIFLNREIIFAGNSVFRKRGPLFLGSVGLFDYLYLNLKKGDNELMFMVGESFGGWGFMCQDSKAVYYKEGISKKWELKDEFSTAESVIYDEKNDVLYVSSFDQTKKYGQGKQFISKISPTGKMLELKWIDELNQPLGMFIYKEKLYISERKNIVEVDIKAGRIIKRIPMPESMFINDLSIDKKGDIYVSDSRKNAIFKISNGKVEEWLSGEEVKDPNGLFVNGDKLIFGNSGDSKVKSADLKTKEIKTIANFSKGIIDGIKADEKGNHIVSIWQGAIYRITQKGKVTKLYENNNSKCADFEYIAKKKLLLIPTFENNSIIAIEMK